MVNAMPNFQIVVQALSSKSWPIMTVPIENEGDVVTVRQRAHRVADLLGFDRQDQTRIATAVSELARNAFGYAGGGRAEFVLDSTTVAAALRDSHLRQGPGHCQPSDHPRWPIPLAKRDGARPDRRPPPDGHVRHQVEAGRRHHGGSGSQASRATWSLAAGQADRNRFQPEEGNPPPIPSPPCASRTAN